MHRELLSRAELAAVASALLFLSVACDDDPRRVSFDPIDTTSGTHTDTHGQGGQGGGTGQGGDSPVEAELEWSVAVGDAGVEYAWALAADPSGNVLVAGYYDTAIDFGDGEHTAQGAYDMFVAKLGSDGGLAWARSFGGLDAESALSIAADADGNVVLAGVFSGQLDLGPGPMQSAGNDLFVAKLDPAGSTLWAKHAGTIGFTSGDYESLEVATDPDGQIVVAGPFVTGAGLAFGGGVLTGAGGMDVFVAKLGADGEHVWSDAFGDAAEQRASDLAVDGSGITLVGAFEGTMQLGDVAITADDTANGFVAHLAGDGGDPWAIAFPGSDVERPNAVAVDPITGDLVVGLSVAGPFTIGDDLLTSQGGSDVVVARLSSTGQVRWAHRFGSDGWEYLGELAIDADGSAVIGGVFDTAIDFGGGPMTSSAGWALFLAKLDVDGEHLWSDHWDVGQVAVAGIAAADVDAIVAGSFAGTLDFGEGAVTTSGDTDFDVFVARLGF